jgi:NADH-quinone oxidoreductase subunit N
MESVPVFSPAAYSGLYPEYAVSGGILAICLIAFIIPRLAAGVSVWIALLAICTAFFYTAADQSLLLPTGLSAGFSTGLLKKYFCVSASVVLFSWLEWRQERGLVFSPLFPCLLLTSVLSLMVLVQATDLWVMILAAEGFSFSAYCLAAWNSEGTDSGMNTLRYFGVGALATGISVFGFTWITGFNEVINSGEGGFSDSMAFFPVAGAVLYLAFIFFKLGCFPFQSWVSGIFISSPAPVAGFLASAPKVAAGFVCLNLVQVLDVNITFPMVFLAIATGILGNLSAFRSRNLKEILGFSAIGQASFLIIPSIFSKQVSGADSQLLFFALTYGIAVQAAFSAIQYFENSLGDNLTTEDLTGIGANHFIPALIFSCLLVSITGLPPFAGFTAKLLVMSALPAGGNLFPSGWLIILYGTGLITTIMAAGYFLPVPFKLFFVPGDREQHEIRSSAASVTVMLAAFLILILLFFYPSIVLNA